MPQAPYGTWESSISADQLATKLIAFFDTVVDQDCAYNVEMRPNDKSRYVIVRYKEDGSVTDMLPAPFSARTRVHEYGGRSFTVHEGTVYFVNFADQCLYKFREGQTPQLLNGSKVRFAELQMTPQGLIAVAEQHFVDAEDKDVTEAKNYIAIINPETGDMKAITAGYDFYAFPTVNKAGNRIAWMCWNHPNMPWDDTQLSVGDLVDGNMCNPVRIGADDPTPMAHFQPRWDGDDLVFISDKTNWSNPYRWHAASNQITPLMPIEADLAVALWTLGTSTWDFYQGKMLFTFNKDGGAKMALVDPTKAATEPPTLLDTPFTTIARICIDKGNIYFIGASGTQPAALVRYNSATGFKILAESTKVELPPAAISVGRHIEFPTTSRQGVAYAYYYPPTNPNFTAPEGTKPPLMVIIHGGPTAAASAAFDLKKQFWTSRGFAVADVNYGGSTGYGRKFRKSLQCDALGQAGYWGEIDVADCVACVEYLDTQVDPDKVVIRGGSAGGYTTLAALAFTKVFKAGASYYGVSDILALARDTHKFESRYMDQLVGPLPQFEALYKVRSPINNLDGFSAPLLVLQGDEDKIVPPNQAETMVTALRARGLRVEYVLYKGEQHGFRNAATIKDSHERELAFYLSVFYPAKPNPDEDRKKQPRMTDEENKGMKAGGRAVLSW